MSTRAALILALAVVAIAPLCFVLFADGHHASPALARQATQPTPSRTIDAGCVERPLAYGLTNDQAQGEQNQRTIMSPFVAHPPVPKPGFYAPGTAPDQNALLHALYHGYVVVRYSRALASKVERELGPTVHHAAQPVVLVAGDHMPFAIGGLVYGRTSICGKLSRATIRQLTGWIDTARPHARP